MARDRYGSAESSSTTPSSEERSIYGTLFALILSSGLPWLSQKSGRLIFPILNQCRPQILDGCNCAG